MGEERFLQFFQYARYRNRNKKCRGADLQKADIKLDTYEVNQS